MEKTKKIKLFLGLSYLIILGVFLYLLFSKFTLQQLTSYEFIKDNLDYFSQLKKTNLFFLSLFFLVFTILWVFPFLGFGSPIGLIGGFILGKWLGSLIVIIGLSIGATFLYIFGNYFLKDIIKEKFLNKFQNLENKFKKSEFLYLLVYRFCGGIPFQLSCILPTLFNVSVKNFFFSTLIGMVPQVFLVVSIGSGLEKVIKENLIAPRIKDIIFSPDIYIPLIIFIILVITSIFFRKKFYQK